ncbi:hypothetical protein Nepgr_024012 [Nepenthes gracilis]|uniref:Uncharacterized protein n=1 Tax=Nepenthes gracilis TaxID=150966 RepID=A0AAD3XZN1_NEPGR|nr:hypothetical protein Nepgr_024012 [Nepenthes gracilis]
MAEMISLRSFIFASLRLFSSELPNSGSSAVLSEDFMARCWLRDKMLATGAAVSPRAITGMSCSRLNCVLKLGWPSVIQLARDSGTTWELLLPGNGFGMLCSMGMHVGQIR